MFGCYRLIYEFVDNYPVYTADDSIEEKKVNWNIVWPPCRAYAAPENGSWYVFDNVVEANPDYFVKLPKTIICGSPAKVLCETPWPPLGCFNVHEAPFGS